MNIVKIGWSGGKDSTCSVIKNIEAGNQVKAVCYIPMLNETIPLISKQHYNFILNTAERFRSLGAEIYIVSGISYYNYVTHRSLKGKYKGQIFGFPCFKKGQCGFKRDSKETAIRECDVGYYDYIDIGIAYDEKKRHNQLHFFKRSILVEQKITETAAKWFCAKNNLLSPHYGNQKRDGCALCPHAPKYERDNWFKDYPEAIPVVIELQEIVKQERPDRTPLRNYEWFIDSSPKPQLSLFDFQR